MSSAREMERRRFGGTSHHVPTIGQGTWGIESDDRASAIAALRRGLDLGMTHIDTAEMYGEGVVEEMVGEAIAGHRRDVVPRLQGTARACLAPRHGRGLRGLAGPARHRLARLLPASLARPSPPGGHHRGLRAAARPGQGPGPWGVSNFDVPDLENARALAGGDQLVCNQVLYHLEQRAIEHRVLPWCEEHGVAVVAYSPFGSGRFPGARTAGGRVLHEIAEAHGATPHQVALRFLVRRPALFAIPKASRVDHTAENAAAGRLQLDDAEMRRIDGAFPLRPRPRTLPVL